MPFVFNVLQVLRRTDPGARPKQTKRRDGVAGSVALSTSSSNDKDKVPLTVSLRALHVFISLTPSPGTPRSDQRQPVRSIAWLYGFKRLEGTNMDRTSAVRWLKNLYHQAVNEKTFSTWRTF